MNLSTERRIFPAIRGVQAGREYYVAMCSVRVLSGLFLFNDEALAPELRAQRKLNKSRIPEMSRYVLDNPESYTFSALTASVDGDMRFEPEAGHRSGALHIATDARVVLNDGQHRRAAMEAALQKNPDLGDETIAVVFFQDRGLERCQQMFADLNRHAIRPSTSLGILYDHRDERSELIRRVVLASDFYRDLVETERTTLARGSRHLFTLSALYRATLSLLHGRERQPLNERVRSAYEYWEAVARQFPEWQQVREHKMTAGAVRTNYLHSHAIVLNALGRVGNGLLALGEPWQDRLERLREIDWSRSNARVWEGRVMVGGRVSKSGNHVTLTTNLIKTKLGLALSDDEQRVEDAFNRRADG